MKPHYFYGVDAYGNVHAFKSKGYRNELVDTHVIETVPAKVLDKVMALTYNRYILVHDTNDIDTYTLIKHK